MYFDGLLLYFLWPQNKYSAVRLDTPYLHTYTHTLHREGTCRLHNSGKTGNPGGAGRFPTSLVDGGGEKHAYKPPRTQPLSLSRSLLKSFGVGKPSGGGRSRKRCYRSPGKSWSETLRRDTPSLAWGHQKVGVEGRARGSTRGRASDGKERAAPKTKHLKPM